MNSFRRHVRALGCAVLLALAPAAAFAHPHVFAEARLDVIVEGRAVTALRHVWRFDDLFSSTVLVEFDADMDNQLNEAELQAVANTVYASLAEFNYFQMVRTQGRDVEMVPPERLVASFEEGQLLILFESRPKASLELAGRVDIGVYDPTFWTAIDYTDDSAMATKGLPASCTRTVVRPDPDDAIAENQATLTEDFFNDPGGNDLGSIFATRLELACPS